MAEPASAVGALLSQVRRRLWLDAVACALRHAGWASCLMLLLAAGLRLAGLRGVEIALGATVLLWPALLARSAWQRPSDAACALWADRRLDGASAYSTWLELGHGAGKQTPALHWLARWLEERVPASRQQLASLPAPRRLAPPLAAAGVCAALAGFVLTLPEGAPAPGAAAKAEVAAAGSVSPVTTAPVQETMASQLADALRDARRREPDAAGPSAAARPGAQAAEDTATAATDAGASAPVGGPPAKDARTGTAPTMAPGTGGIEGGGGIGRDAGGGRDERADPGRSAALRAAAGVPRSETLARTAALERRADRDLAADFGTDTAAAAGIVGAEAPAARPPAAGATARLTMSQTSYVQAWMKARDR